MTTALSGASDGYEFPAGMFGYVPDWLPDLIGRVVMMAALVEGKVDSLLMNLGTGVQSTHAGKPVLSNINMCRRRLNEIENGFADLVRSTRPLLVDVEDALKRRNAVVHSLWPDNSREVARGWRNVPPNQREKAADKQEPIWIDWVEMDRDRFVQLLEELEHLVEGLALAIAASGSVNAPML